MRIHDSRTKLNADLTDQALWSDPYDLYPRIFDLKGLARCSMPMQGDAWLAARHEDVQQVLKDTDTFKNNPRSVGQKGAMDYVWTPKVLDSFSRSMVFADGVDHRRLRRLANKAFTPKRVTELMANIDAITQGLLDEAAQGSRFDLMSAFALPLPLRIISEMMGVEPEERATFHGMLDAALNFGKPWKMFFRMPTYFSLYRFFERLLERKRVDPGEDLISALVAAEEEGDQLTPDELMGTVFLLLFAGHETTVNLIGNGMLALLEHPEELERLREDPALIPVAIEEMLRFYSPANLTSIRYASKPCVVGGVSMDHGDAILPLVGAANRDPSAFETPNAFDAGRTPNPHLAFGAGAHFCIGAHLSRLEGKIAFERLLDSFGDIRLDVDRSTLHWRGANLGLRGLSALPVAVGRVSYTAPRATGEALAPSSSAAP